MPRPKKASSTNSGLKFQNFGPRKSQTIGVKPLDSPSSFSQLILMVYLHICKKVLHYQPEFKAVLYLILSIVVSGFFDFVTPPKSYFGSKDTIFNQYFVKLGWGWTLIVLGAFIFYTSEVYCCGNRNAIIKHLCRLLVGTLAWYFCTNAFVTIENSTGLCSTNKKLISKIACVKGGHTWLGFDISGHSFLLVYCGLMILEEAKAFKGWEKIEEFIRNKEFDENGPLKNLSDDEFSIMASLYESTSLYIKGVFVLMTFFSILWDVMLVTTFIYFHNMLQKFIGTAVAVMIWFITYRVWYLTPFSPGLPGEGALKYNESV